MHANIIGSGIAGPRAAITLREQGYTVDVWEARTRADLHSDGILNINGAVWNALLAHGVNCVDTRQLIPSDEYGLFPPEQEFHNITWTDLHLSLTERAEELGAVFHYGAPFRGEPADLTICATGVGSAKEVTQSHYTGYVVARGLSYQLTGEAWQWVTELPNVTIAIGDIRTGASVAAFIPRENATLRTTYTPEMPDELSGLSLRWHRLFETVPVWQIAPLSDWDVPNTMFHTRGGSPEVRIGDANGQMRPNTASGANLALKEAGSGELLIQRSSLAEWRYLNDRKIKHDLGLTRPF